MTQGRRQKVVTKKHLARVERERILRRNILIGTFAVFFAVIALIGYGFIDSAIVKPRQPVAFVNDETITSGEFQKRVRYQRQQLVQQYLNTYQTRQLFAEDPNTASFFDNNLRQIQIQLEDPTFLGREVLNTMIDERLIRNEAIQQGITVNQEEIEKELQGAFGYYPDGTPTQRAFATSLPTSTLSPTQLALVSPTPTRTPNPDLTPTATLTATGSIEPTPTQEAVPTSTPYTFEAYQANYQQVIDLYRREINFREQDFLGIFEAQLLGQKVFDSLTGDTPSEQEQVWARHILVDEEETALSILDRLAAGEDWAALAAELSTDTSNKDRGGDLNWFPRGRMVDPFEEIAFQLAIGEVSNPVETDFGWHIIQVLGHELRSLSSAEVEQVRQVQIEEWLATQRDASDIEILDIWTEHVPDEPSIPPHLLDLPQPAIITPPSP